MLIESINPATGEPVGKIESTRPDDISQIVSCARKAQKDWVQRPHGERVKILKEFGRLLYLQKHEIANLISRENGKPTVEAYTSEIIPSLDLIKYYSKQSRRLLRPRHVKIAIPLLKTKKAFIANEPIGVAGIISPWNYPLLLPLGQIIPALIIGNSVVFKPSEYTPIIGEITARLLYEAGVPRNVFNIVQGTGEVGAALISSGVNKVFFTGSTATGKKVSELAAKHLIPISLELGSKDAMIVLDDADLDSAASGAIWGAFMNAGQTCVSVERCFVDEKVHDHFVKLLQEKLTNLKVGSGTDANVDVGAMIHRTQFEIVKLHVDDAIRREAKIIAGGAFSEQKGYFIQPTILINVPMDSLLMTEETFGPVLPIVKFRSDDEAVELANSSRFGLSASVWTRDKNRGMQIARKLEAGAAIINDVISYYGMSDGIVGGVKESGSGRVHGKEGLLEMVYQKYYEIERTPRWKKLWWYGYDQDTFSFFETATDFLFADKIFKKITATFKLIPAFLRIKKI